MVSGTLYSPLAGSEIARAKKRDGERETESEFVFGLYGLSKH